MPSGHNRPPGPDRDDIIDDFTRILTHRRSADVPCHISTCFNKADPHRGLDRTRPDPVLTDLFGFDEDSLPEMGNLFCADIGLAGPKLHIWAFIRTMGEQITRLNSAGTSRRFRLAS